MGIYCGGVEGKEEIGMYIRDLDDHLWVLDNFPTPAVYGTECSGKCWFIGNTLDVVECPGVWYMWI